MIRMWFRVSLAIVWLSAAALSANAQRNTDVPLGPVVSPSILEKPKAPQAPADKGSAPKDEQTNTKPNSSERPTGTTKPK